MVQITSQQIILFAILGGALVLFAWGRIRYDVVAIVALLLAVVAGIVDSADAFSGFGHPAVITVAAVLILSGAVRDSGLVDPIVRLLRPLAKRPSVHVLSIAGIGAAMSAFMNNVGALALMLPLTLQSASANRRPASQLLMPLSFATLLGGLTTLIGTPPNIIIASIRRAETGTSFSMFDFAPVGLGVAVLGLLFIASVGWRLLPFREAGKADTDARTLFRIEDYITEVRLPAGSPYVGRRLVDLEALGQGDIAVVALERRGDRMLAPSGYLRLQAGDVLILEADAQALRDVVKEAALDTLGAGDFSVENLRSERVSLMEAVITPGSRLEGRTARALGLHTRFGVNLLGVARQGERMVERLGQVRLRAGDILLLQGEEATLRESLAALGCLPLAFRGTPLGRKRLQPLPPLIFAGAIGLVVSGLMPPHIAFVAAVVALVLVRAVPLRDLYEEIDWPIILLLGALIPVGEALQTTGATEVITHPILAFGDHVPGWGVLALLMVVTMLLSDIMNNAATAVIMAPLGIAIAKGLGANVDPFLMAVAIGASSTYLTPIGHQSNLLVMGPGGYRFGDYWRMGLPLDALIVLSAVPLILVVWPL